MRIRTAYLPGLGLLLALMLSSCSFAPKYEQPGMDIPAEWRIIDSGDSRISTKWWERFSDPVLNAMVEEALKNNQNIEESLAKVDSSRYQLYQATSSFLPTVSANGSAGATGSSLETSQGSALPSRSNSAYQGNLSAAWELDLWGKYRNTYTALSDMLLSTSAGYYGTLLSVAGQTSMGYFSLLGYDLQLQIARNTLKSREAALKIYSSRFSQGDITELDWLRAKSEAEVARAQLHTATVNVDKAEASLAVMLGRSPRDIMSRSMERGIKIEKMPSPPILPSGIPSEVLLRRPDIRAAEYTLMAYNANIGIVRADYFPSISLTGSIGTFSTRFNQLFSTASGQWSYGVQGVMTVLDFGRTWYRDKDAQAQKDAAIAIYRYTVQKAFEDIRTSLTRQREADAIVRSYKAQVDNLQRATSLARTRYDNGYSDYLEVLDTERQLFAAQLQWANSLTDRLNAVVSVCMAFGGGWEDIQEVPRRAEESTKVKAEK